MLSKFGPKLVFRFSSAYLKRLQELYKQNKHQEILGIESLININKEDVHGKYISLIKQYHTDVCHNDPIRAAQYGQITKIIIASYNTISKKYFPRVKQENEDEDEICKDLFGKTYTETKYWMHQPGNEKFKEAFYARLKANVNYEQKPSYEYRASMHHGTMNQPWNQKQTSSSRAPLGIAIPMFCAVLFGFAFFANKVVEKAKETAPLDESLKRKQYKNEDVDKILGEAQKNKNLKAQTMIDSLVKEQPPALFYPQQEIHVLKQLTEYSIAPDIHLYEVPAAWYEGQKERILEKGVNRENLHHLTRIKANTALTLSLEAERAYQNIYVKVKDVMKELNQTGKFTPPVVFLRFHGYIMAEIRDKPLSLRNYRDTDYISIFDLFFDYYSPIPIKKNQFSEYLVNKDDMQYFGWVHLNNRKCNPVYLKQGQKVAFFHSERPQMVSARYQLTWANFYRQYQERWAEGGNSKSKLGI